MKATNNNKLVPRPSITLLMRALFASPRTKCSIANTICLLAIALATILAVALFSSCSTTKQTSTDSHITATHTTTADSLTATSTQKTISSQATVLGDFVAEQSAASNTTTATEEETTTETITDITTSDGTQKRITERKTTRCTTNTLSTSQNAATSKKNTLMAYEYADSLISATYSRLNKSQSDSLTQTYTHLQTPTSPAKSPIKIAIVIIIGMAIAEILSRLTNKNNKK